MLESGPGVLAVRPLRAAEVLHGEQQADKRPSEDHIEEGSPLIRDVAANEDQRRNAPNRRELSGGPNRARRGDGEIGQGSRSTSWDSARSRTIAGAIPQDW